MKVNEIFQSIEGEGKRAGELATFIRLCGCNLRCNYCDTSYAFSMNSGKDMTPDEILDKVQDISIGRNITITGGEPLCCEEVKELIEKLLDDGYKINVETNGTMLKPLNTISDYLFYTIDYKCPDSGECDKMNPNVFKSLVPADVLKFVVSSTSDLEHCKQWLDINKPLCNIYFSPVFGRIEAKEIVEFLQEHKMASCKVQLQLHKYIWPPEMRGV